MLYNQVIKQKSYEKIIFLLRRHPITFVPRILLFIILLGVEVGVYFLLQTLFPQLFTQLWIFAVLVLFASAYTLSIWLFLYTAFVNYFLDMWFVTNDRVVDVRQEGLFSRTIAETDLYRTQDVTSECNGIFATVFNYGNVYIQTAGAKERFVFSNVAYPHKIREDLIKLADEDRKIHMSTIKQE